MDFLKVNNLSDDEVLAEALAQRRFNDQGTTDPVSPAELEKWKKELTASAADDFYTRWAKWFFADRGSHTISPFSTNTVPDYVQQRIKENTFESLREALLLSPNNAVALAKQAKGLSNLDPAKNPALWAKPISLAAAPWSCRPRTPLC